MSRLADYDDLFLRQSLGETAPRHVGGWASPDVIPFGDAPAPDPSQLAREYDRDLGKSLVPGVTNYVYVRTKNPRAAVEAVPGRLFAAHAAPRWLLWPDALEALSTQDGKPYDPIRVAGGEVGVSKSAFVLTPGSVGDAIAAYVVTPEHPVPLPSDLRDVDALADFFQRTPAFAQRSVVRGMPAPDRYVHRAAYEQRDATAGMMVSIDCTECPTAWSVGLLPEDPSGPLRIVEQRLQRSTMSLVTDADVRAGYRDTLSLVVDRHGVAGGPAARVRVVVYRLLADGRRLPLGGHEITGAAG